MARGGAISDNSPDHDYLDAFLQGARFALFTLEGRLTEDDHSPSPEVTHTIDEVHELFSATRKSIETRETSLASVRHYLGKN